MSVSQKDDFCFDSLPTENIDDRAQVYMFLTDTSRDIDCLHKFPLSKKLFFFNKCKKTVVYLQLITAK